MKNIKRKSIKWWIGIALCMVLFGAIGVFAYFKTIPLTQGVQIQAMIDQKDTNSPMIEITGKAKNAVYVALDGREIFIDKDGTFKERVALLPGLGVVTINAEDKFGKTSQKKFELMYAENTGMFAYNEQPITSN
jgi:hypothetical protein